MVGAQFHPEFTSRAAPAAAAVRDFVGAAAAEHERRRARRGGSA